MLLLILVCKQSNKTVIEHGNHEEEEEHRRHSETNILQNIFFCIPHKIDIQVWNGMRVSKLCTIPSVHIFTFTQVRE